MLTGMARQTAMHIAFAQAVAVDGIFVELYDSFAITTDNLAVIAQSARATCQRNDTAPPRMIRAADLN